jgi:hypothetical protein
VSLGPDGLGRVRGPCPVWRISDLTRSLGAGSNLRRTARAFLRRYVLGAIALAARRRLDARRVCASPARAYTRPAVPYRGLTEPLLSSPQSEISEDELGPARPADGAPAAAEAVGTLGVWIPDGAVRAASNH